ncbi:hypothetical protein N657DRAFT_128069 [Parathielavia appendiculata]|uniref:Uncharacterized protein n=1 Tax=Parathielavia appendiculata TaxID=2587402 RepID=A0AAN6Z100_9PEZI|nr:hypothetical protein N657DRAFT_128069 [Parathielavia appendiculata]
MVDVLVRRWKWTHRVVLAAGCAVYWTAIISTGSALRGTDPLFMGMSPLVGKFELLVPRPEYHPLANRDSHIPFTGSRYTASQIWNSHRRSNRSADLVRR